MNEAEKIISLLDSRELGRRLRLTRRKRGMTQAQAADAIGIARTTMVAIEKGERIVRPEELLGLSIAYGRDLSAFIEQTPKELLFAEPQFRGSGRYDRLEDNEIDVWIEELRILSYNYYDLEQRLDSPLVKRYPSDYQLGMLRADELGEMIAQEERQRLGLGDGPISDLRRLLEQEVGLRIYYFPIKPRKFSAIYMYSDRIGGCIAINSHHPEVRARFSLAHEYGHFLSSRFSQNIYVSFVYPGRSKAERVADSFAAHFLMPGSGIAKRFKEIRNLKSKFTSYDLVEMAHYFRVSVEALSYRLENLGLIPTGKLEELRAKGFKVQEAQKHLGLQPQSSTRRRLPERHQLLALEALESGLISASEAAELLEVSLVELRTMNTAVESLEQRSE